MARPTNPCTGCLLVACLAVVRGYRVLMLICPQCNAPVRIDDHCDRADIRFRRRVNGTLQVTQHGSTVHVCRVGATAQWVRSLRAQMPTAR